VALARRERDLVRALSSLEQSHQQLQATQLQLIQAAKMESIGRLAAGVAHEVKNPLTTLLMGIEYIETHLDAKTPELDTVLREMDAAVARANRVVLGLLDFSAPGSLEIRDESLVEVVETAIGLVRHECAKAGITVVREFETRLPRLPMDRNKIEQVFVNLLLNAVQAMSEGGTLTIRIREVAPREAVALQSDHNVPPQGGWRNAAVAELEDTGTGIDPSLIAKVFEPFFSTKRTETNAGLGLAVVKRIVDLHAGTIALENRPEGGLRVRVALRTRNGGEHAREAESPAPGR
jgi:signal transduction histidine kinase